MKLHTGRDLSFKIMDAYAAKLSGLKHRVPKLLAEDKDQVEHGLATLDTPATDTAKECRTLLKTLVIGFKNIVWAHLSIVKRLAYDEVQLMSKVFRDGLRCLAIYRMDADDGQVKPEQVEAATSPAMEALWKERKEVLDAFTGVFTMLDSSLPDVPQNFLDIMTVNLNYFYEQCIEAPLLLNVAQTFAQYAPTPAIAKTFTDLLLNFLIDNMANLAGEKKEGAVLLKLFKVAFAATSLLPDLESILSPHLPNIITQAMRLSSETKEPTNYFLLIKSLFRSVQGRNEIFTKEFLPLVQGFLEGLNRLQVSAHSPQLRELFIELSLTVPVRTSAMLPHLRSLMKPLVLCIESGVESLEYHSSRAMLGIRLLETFIDKMSPEFLDPVLAEWKPRLLRALWRHLRPPPYMLAPHILRILGKLSGRNRDFFNAAPQLTTNEQIEQGLVISVAIDPTHTVDLPISDAVNAARKCLLAAPPAQPPVTSQPAPAGATSLSLFNARQLHAYNFLKACVVSMLDISSTTGGKFDVSDTISEVDAQRPLKVDLSVDGIVYTKSVKQLEAEIATFKACVSSVLLASKLESCKDVAAPFLEFLASHFAHLLVSQRPVDSSKLLELDPATFIDALVDVLCSENREHAAAGTQVLDVFVATATQLASGFGYELCDLPVCDQLSVQLASCCYKREWFQKAGGCLGIAYLTEKLPGTWVQKHALAFLKALLFILKDLSASVSVGTVEDAQTTATRVLKVLFAKSDDVMQVDGAASLSETQTDAALFMALQLHSSNSSVRKAAQAAVTQISELTGLSIPSLLTPFKEQLFGPILSQPIRKLSTKVQTGYLEALAFGLNTTPPLIGLTDELKKLVLDIIPIAEQEEQINRPKANHANRLAVLELLASLHAHPDTHTPEHEDLRARAMGVFFKGLTSRNKPTVQVARKGIINFTAQSAVPKDVLQASLRPILLNLADFRKLNEPLLDSLCRLLALLNKCFTATLSKALYDHLQRWLSPTTMAASKQWKAGEEIKIATGILETFHLLPTAVGVPPTVEQLVDVVLRLESLLSTYGTRKAVPRDLTSPFRDPLAKYLSRCAPEAVTFFLDKLGAEPHTRLFKSILRNEHSGGLREELTRNLDKLLAATLLTTKTNDERIAPYIHGVQIIRSLVKFNPAWLDENESALKAVLGLWNSQDRKDLVAREANLTVFQTKLSRLLVKCLLTYVRAHPEKPEILFDLLAVFNEVSATDYTFLEEFFATDLPVKFPVQYKRAIINLFIDLFPKADYSPEHKVQALKVLIIPMLTHCFEVKEDVLDNETISRLVKGVYIGEGVADYSAALNVELLKLATLLVKARKDETVEHRKDLIKLAWIRMKADDPAKHTAYVLTCHLIAYHDTPAKVVLQIFVTLLRAYQQETKALVREALDVLTPALRLRLPNRPDEHPVWVKWMKKLLAEESHQLPQLVHMLQLIVRIPDPFFPYRGQLIPYMVNALNRIGLTSGTPLEQRKLSLSLVELMVSWEQKKNEAPTAEPASSEVGPTSPLTQGDSMDVDVKPTGGSEGNLAQSTEQPVQQPQIMEFRMNPQMMDIVVSFLVRVASGAADTAQRDQTQAASSGVILHAALRILREALAVWPAAQVKPQFLEKLLAPVTDSPPIVVVGLQILDIVLENDTFLPNGIPLLEAAFLPSQNDPTKIGVIASDNPKITEALCPVLSKILRKYPLGPESPVDNMFTKICEILTGSLLAEKSNSENATTIIKAISEQAPNYFRPAAPALMKYCIRLIRDYTKPDAPADPQGANSAQKKAQRAQATVIFSIISLLGSQLAALADMKHQNGQPVETKKQLMLAVVHLLEKSSDEHLFMNLIKLLKDWMSQPDALTAKDKNAFLGKMRRFEKVGQPRALPLHAEYYDMVYSLYTSETTNFAEMPMLETTALAALCSRDTATRHRFLELFRRRLSTDLPDRLVQLLSHSTWENLPYLFWIQPALDCLLAMVPEDHGLNLSSHSALVPKLAPASGSDPGMPDLQQVEALRSMRIKDLITPLREVLFNEQDLSMQQWTSMFVALWDTSLTRPERLRIHESLSTLLSHDSINKQARVQPNVVQALMHSFCHLKVNKIQLPVAVLKYLGTSFNSWHATISLLEEHLGSRRPEQVSAALSALGDLYKRLGEDDYHIGILTHQAQINDTRAGLVLEQHGMWPRAQEVYYQALRHAQIGVLPDVPPKEHDIWESHWIECSKRLSQWELLQDYAKHNQQPELLAESSWKLGDWSQLKEAFTKFAYSNDSYKVKIFQSFVFLQDVKIHEVDTLCKSAMQFLVAQWVSLPRIPSAAYTGFLHVRFSE
jgi:transformation/transcription domain-associated protein